MGKKTKKRPRWRKLSLDEVGAARSPSPGHSEGGSSGSHREKPRPRSRQSFTRSHSVTTYVFDEDEYTKIQTPRQDMIFKKSAFTKRRVPVEGSLSEEAETRSISACSEQATSPPHHPAACGTACCPACAPVSCPNSIQPVPPSSTPTTSPTEHSSGTPSEATASTPEMSEVSSEGKATSECGDGLEPSKDPLAALASQIQYAFIDPQGNVFFNVMDESGIIHLPPVAGYYMAPSYPGGPMIATPVPWQALPIAPLDSPEYQALMAHQRKQQQQQQTQQQQQQQLTPEQQQQPQQQDVTEEDGDRGSRSDSRRRSETSDTSALTTSGAGSRPHTPTPTPPGSHVSSGQELGDVEPETVESPVEEGKTRRIKKKKKKQKKKTSGADSGVTDEGSDGSRDIAPPPADGGAVCSSDTNASSGRRLRPAESHKTERSSSGRRLRPAESHKTERSSSEQTSGVQSDVSLPDSPQRRPSGEHGHVTVTSQRDVSVLHSAASVLSRQLDSQQLTSTYPVTTATPPPSPTAPYPAQPKNEEAAVSALEAAIMSRVQRTTVPPAASDVEAVVVDDVVPASAPDSDAVTSSVTHSCDVADDVVDDAAVGQGTDEYCPSSVQYHDDALDVEDRVDVVDDDEESCDSFVYEDKSGNDLESTSLPVEEPSSDNLSKEDDPCQVESSSETPGTLCQESCEEWEASEMVAEFEQEEAEPRTPFTDLSLPVDLRRTVILEETESERERESSPGSALSEETRSHVTEHTPEPPPLESLPPPSDVTDTTRRQSTSDDNAASVEEEAVPKVDGPIQPTSSNTRPKSLYLKISATAEKPASIANSQTQVLMGEVPHVETESAFVEKALNTSASLDVLPESVAASSERQVLTSASQCQTNASSNLERTPPPDESPPPDRRLESSPTSSVSDKSISSAVRGWLKEQSPDALFVIAADSADEADSDEDWESDVDAGEESANTSSAQTGSKNVQGNPSPAPRSKTALAGDRVASHLLGLSSASVDHTDARRDTTTFYSLGVPLDEPDTGAAVRVIDLDDCSVLTLPLEGAPATYSMADDDDASSHSESVAGPAELASQQRSGAVPPSASLARELLQAGSIHRASDRKLIGDSAIFAAGAGAAAEEVDEGYGGSPLASPEVRRLDAARDRPERARRLPPHPLRHVQTETGAPWGICCSLQ